MKQHLAVLTIITALASFPAHADAIDDAAADGAAFASGIFPDTTVDENGNVTIGGTDQEEELSAEELFPDAGTESPDTFTSIDSEEEADAAGEQARGEGSDAIDVLDATENREREDLANDPFLDPSEEVFGSIDAAAEEFGACSTVRETIPVVKTSVIPEERFCERIQKVEGSCTITHQIVISNDTVVTDVWGPDDCMIAASHAVGPSVCTGTVTVTAGAELEQCLEIDGVTICPGDPLHEQLVPPPFDGHEQAVSRLAQSIEIGPLDCEANLAALPCYTTSAGEEVCPADEGMIIDTCGGLRADPLCRFVEQDCVPGAQVGGICYLEEARFTCDREITHETYGQQTSLSCPDSEIRCNGNECIDVQRETNNEISIGLAASTASQLLAFDSTCESLDPATCQAYPGTIDSCQRGIGGIFDACELPAPPGPGPYLDLVFSIGALDTNLTFLSPASPLRGAWEKLRDPAVSAIESLETPVTTVSNSVTASTSPNANQALAEQDLAAARQDLQNGTADAVFEAFGAGAVNTLFVDQATGGPVAEPGGRAGDAILRQPPDGKTALSLVADAYGISAGETIPALPDPPVEPEDLAMAAHDDAQNCLVIGSQCTPDSFGACISRDRVHCCFNAPLSRLAQESAVPQFGREFGTVEEPNCRGLTAGEIQAFDWTTFDMDQWIAILGTANRYPDPDKLTPDGLTGTGNFLDVVDPDQSRTEVIERTQLRLDGLDAVEIRARSSEEIRANGE